MPHHVHSISVQGSLATIPSATVPRQDRLTRVLQPRSEPSPVYESPFSLSRMSRSTTAQGQLPRFSLQGSGRVEQWIEDQRGEDQDPNLLSPMPRHSDTIVRSRRIAPVTPRSIVPQQDASDFVFVDDDEEVSTRKRPIVI